MPTEQDIGKAYETYYTHREREEPLGSFAAMVRRIVSCARSIYLTERYGYASCRLPGTLRKIVFPLFYVSRSLRESVDIPFAYLLGARGRLLDVGCGDGSVVKLGCELGWDAVGVEVDPKAAENALSKGLKIHLGDLAAQAFSDNSFDLILMNHVIEHVHDPSALLRECQRVLRPGARMVVATPNIGSWGHSRFGRHWRGLEPPRHLHIFSSRALAKVAASANFKEVNIATIIRGAPFIFRTSRWLRRAAEQPTRRGEKSGSHLYGCLASIAEQVLVGSNPLRGEELLLEARK